VRDGYLALPQHTIQGPCLAPIEQHALRLDVVYQEGRAQPNILLDGSLGVAFGIICDQRGAYLSFSIQRTRHTSPYTALRYAGAYGPLLDRLPKNGLVVEQDELELSWVHRH
jgi:hypothetical protein